jgi:hypothetical protein
MVVMGRIDFFPIGAGTFVGISCRGVVGRASTPEP